jgi:hypothetical protein
MRKLLPTKPVFLLAAFAIMMALPVTAFAAATITIVNIDGPGEGFNDPTRAKKVGGNPGKTIGEQRLIAFQFAADIWGATLDSNVEIRIQASFDPLACTANSAVLGSAGAIQIVANFPGQEFANTWYHVALANKLAGSDLIPGSPGTSADDIRARFNSNLGQPNCLAGIGWYYGLDNNHGTNIDLVTVLLHEFAHGLGFSNFVDESTGQEPFPPGNLTDIYARFTFDNTAGKTWDQMNDPERKASAINSRNVVWVGQNVTAAVPQVLSLGTPFMFVNSPAAIAGRYNVGPATFGPQLTAGGITGNVVLALDPANAAGPSTTDACSPLTNGATVTGNIALVDRGTCTFTTKVKNAQNAGATAVIVADNVAGSPPPGLGGTDPTITIPSVRITLDDGNTIKGHLGVGVNVTLRLDTTRAGADPNGRALLNAPDPVQLGSSISHWDPIAFPNQLMEPSINSDLTHQVVTPFDMTFELLTDIGW